MANQAKDAGVFGAPLSFKPSPTVSAPARTLTCSVLSDLHHAMALFYKHKNHC